MIRVPLDQTLRDKLHNLTQPLELCDDEGLVVARVIPVQAEEDFEPREPQVSEEELRRRQKSPGKYYTTEELLKILRERP
jgi:hypothetical protein